MAQAKTLTAQELEQVFAYVDKNRYAELYRDWETDRKSTRLNSSH